MNIVANHDASGQLYYTPEYAQIPSGENTVSITIVPPNGAGWTITAVSSNPSATWTNNTADLPENAYDISITATDSGKNGTGTFRVSGGVKDVLLASV